LHPSDPVHPSRLTNPPADRHEAEALFTSALGAMDRIIASLCRRHGVRGDDADDFASWARLRLIEHDYAAIRKFRGESSLTTYLAVVLAMLFREYRVQRWGRWRPSAEAKRRGPLAIRLETLVRRDKMRFDEAAQLLRTAGETTLDDRALAQLLQALPLRDPTRPHEVGDAALALAPAAGSADTALTAAEDEVERHSVRRAIDDAMSQLVGEDQVIVRLRYWEGLSVADIARALGVEQKPLYRRLERTLGELRRRLAEAGVSDEAARALLTDHD
jgi:RNA polymerase sigma factor for flagellar operon FliA